MIGLYKGTSAISRIIKFRTWSEYSHAAWINEDFSVIEAWQGAGVVERPSVNIGHTPGTEIDLFDIDLTPRELGDLMFFLQSQIGKPYDYNGVFGFLTRDASMQSRSAWFCFELIFAAFVYAQKPLLLRVPAHKVDGGMLSYSPLLRHVGGIRTASPTFQFPVSSFTTVPGGLHA